MPAQDPDTEAHPWQRLPGEKWITYAPFCIYRDLGAGRSLTQAVRVWLTAKDYDPRATRRTRQQRRYATHPYPGKYLRTLRQHWGRWSSKWRWVERAAAYDDWVAAEAERRMREAAVQAALAEAEENERQRRARLEEARTLAAVSFRGLAHAAPVALARLRRARDRMEEALAAGGDAAELSDAVHEAVQVLSWATRGMEVAHRLEREALGQPGSTVGVRLEPALVERLADVIVARVPEPEQEAVASEIAALLRGEASDAAARGAT